MKQSRYNKDDNTGDRLAVPQVGDRDVYVAQRPHVHGRVPRAPEHGDVVRVPPVAVELAVGKVQQLTHQVEERVERKVEEA